MAVAPYGKSIKCFERDILQIIIKNLQNVYNLWYNVNKPWKISREKFDKLRLCSKFEFNFSAIRQYHWQGKTDAK